MKTIVYEDEHIRVIHRVGAGNVLVVTFGDLFSLANEMTFFAEDPIKRRNLHAIGFMAKGRNWFPAASVEAAIVALKNLLSSTPTRIVYGGSMGGYAALKFSKKLKATRVYALVPQYSINPSSIIDHRYNKYHNEEVNGNDAITAQDLHGEIFITHDPAYKIDDLHVKKIVDLGISVTKVPLRFSLHGATTILASSLFFDEITRNTPNGVEILSAIFKIQKRKSRFYLEGLVEYASRKHPVTALKIVLQQLEAGLLTRNDRICNLISKCLSVVSTDNSEPDLIQRIFESGGIWRNNAIKGYALKSVHSMYLCYDALSRSIHQYPLAELNGRRYIHPIMVKGPYGLTSISLDHREDIIVCHGDICSLIEEGADYNQKGFVVYRKWSDGNYVVSNSEKNLCAAPNGKCSFNVDHVRAWEKFSIEEICLP